MIEPTIIVYDLAPVWQRLMTLLGMLATEDEYESLKRIRPKQLYKSILFDLNNLAFCQKFPHANPNPPDGYGLDKYLEMAGFGCAAEVVDRLLGDGLSGHELGLIELKLTENPYGVWRLSIDDFGILVMNYDGDFRILEWERQNLNKED